MVVVKGVTFNQDGGVTLDSVTWDDLKEAYTALYDNLGSGPTYIGDFFSTDEDLFRKVVHWKSRVEEEAFHPEEYGLDEDLDEDFLPADSPPRTDDDGGGIDLFS